MVIFLYFFSISMFAVGYFATNYFWDKKFWMKNVTRKMTIRILPIFTAIILSDTLMRLSMVQTTFFSRILVLIAGFILGDLLVKWYKK